LKGDSKQFLIPVTLAEVKSYKSGNRAEASKLLNGLISKLQQLSRVNQIDSNQKALLVRALLLKGNLHFYAKQHSEAAKCYNTAADVDPKNPFPHLSWAQLGGSHDPTVIASRWKEGLTLLEDPKSGALQKREITTKVTACAWAVITTRALNDAQRASHYAQELETIGKSIRPIANRIPLFFSPISKIPLSFEDLSEELP
jgi:tetratricopeptide (TPR) repeat protein